MLVIGLVARVVVVVLVVVRVPMHVGVRVRVVGVAVRVLVIMLVRVLVVVLRVRVLAARVVVVVVVSGVPVGRVSIRHGEAVSALATARAPCRDSERTTAMAAPKPLSMFTTVTPAAQLESMPRSAAKPPLETP